MFLRKLLKKCASFWIFLTIHFGIVLTHKTRAYNHEKTSTIQNVNWMRGLQSETHIFDLSILGTHETMSQGYGGPIAQCQTLSLETQLISGIRAFDIRCRHVQDKFAIHHGFVFQHVWFGDVLCTMTKFLRDNPSEFILMRVKEEYTAVNSTREFQETFQFYRNETQFSKFFWIPNTKYPKVNDVRGKIVVLDDFSGSDKYGLNYGNGRLFSIQDHYHFHSNWDLYQKWIDVKNQLIFGDGSRVGKGNRSLFVNYLSGSYGALPYFVASGHATSGTGAHRLSTGFTTPGWKNKYPDFPRVDCVLGICTIAFEGTNVLTYSYLNGKGIFQISRKIQYTGIIFADFPGDGLIETIISLNSLNMNLKSNSFDFHTVLLLLSVSFLLTLSYLIFVIKFKKSPTLSIIVPLQLKPTQPIAITS